MRTDFVPKVWIWKSFELWISKFSRNHLTFGVGSPSNSTSNLACSFSKTRHGWIFLVKTGGFDGLTGPSTTRSCVVPLCSTSVFSVAVIFLVISLLPITSFCVCFCFETWTSLPWTVVSDGSGMLTLVTLCSVDSPLTSSVLSLEIFKVIAWFSKDFIHQLTADSRTNEPFPWRWSSCQQSRQEQHTDEFAPSSSVP